MYVCMYVVNGQPRPPHMVVGPGGPMPMNAANMANMNGGSPFNGGGAGGGGDSK